MHILSYIKKNHYTHHFIVMYHGCEFLKLAMKKDYWKRILDLFLSIHKSCKSLHDQR